MLCVWLPIVTPVNSMLLASPTITSPLMQVWSGTSDFGTAGLGLASKGRTTTQVAFFLSKHPFFRTPLTRVCCLKTHLRASAAIRSPRMELFVARAVTGLAFLSFGWLANQPFRFELIADLHDLTQRQAQFLSDLIIE
jgi:hypothetical protein